MVGVQLKRHNFGQWGSFRGLVDIPMMCLFVRELWWETHGLGAMSPPKPQFRQLVPCIHCRDCAQQLSMTSSSCLPFAVQRHSHGGSTFSSSLYNSVSPQILCHPSSFDTFLKPGPCLPLQQKMFQCPCLSLAICRPSDCTVASGVGVVVDGVCNALSDENQ